MSNTNEALRLALCKVRDPRGVCDCEECHRSLIYERAAEYVEEYLNVLGYSIVRTEALEKTMPPILPWEKDR